MKNRNEVDPNAPDRGMGSILIGALAMIVVLALVYVWAPWSGNRTVNNTPAGTTVGQGSAPQTKSQQTTGTPAPSTNQ